MRLRVLDMWRPRFEIGRRIKHKLKYGLSAEPPTTRLRRRFL